MILYFADRKMNILGTAATDLPDGILIRDDVKVEDIDSGISTLSFKIPYGLDHAIVRAMVREGNYILRNYDRDCEFYTILDIEDDSDREEVEVYAEDAGLDLLNEIVGEFSAPAAKPVAFYVNEFAYDSGFEIGVNEISDRERKLSWDGESTAAERIRSVATQFDAEIGYRFDIKGLRVMHKYIDLYRKRGKDIAQELRLHREIGRIIEKRSIADLVTALRVTGGTPEGEEDPVTLDGYTYDDGDIYVENGMLFSRSALAEWSRYLSETGDNVGHIVGAKTYEATTKASLCTSAVKDLRKYSKPQVTYEAEIMDLPENLKVGDTVRIVDRAGELYLSARLLKMETRASERTQTATLGDYLVKSAGISAEVQAMAEEFRRAAKSRYTWYAYADDAAGSGISLDSTGKSYVGIAPNRLAETPDVTNPAVYTWSLIKGSTPVIEATKEGGTTTITADGEPIAEIEDGNGIASKTDYYMLADTMDSSALSEARSHLPQDMTGTVVTISDAMGDIPFETVTVDVVPIQSGSGDPSPTNIRPITGWTGATVTRTGKNLLEPKVFTSGTGFTNPVKVDFSKYPSYTFSCNISTDICRTMIYGYSSKSDALGDVNKIARTAGTVENVRTISKDLFTYEVAGDVDSIEYIVVRFYGSRTTAQDLNNGEIQVEIGSSATAFEPYNGASYPFTWSDTAGTVYGGTLDVLNGTLRVEYGIIDLGTLNWTVSSAERSVFRTGVTGRKYSATEVGYCSSYKFYGNDTLTHLVNNLPDNNVGFQVTTRYILIRDTRFTDAESFKTAVTGQKLVYPLASPQTYQLTPVEIESLAGANNVWADAGDVSLTYYDDLSASWHDEPLEPNAYSKYLWWYYNTTYTDGRSVNSDPAIIGVYNQDWFEDTQKAQATADGALSTADAAVVDASKAQSAANEAAEAALAAQNAANAAIENITITAASLETLRTSAMQQLAELQAAIGEFRAWISFSSETSLVVGKQSASNNYVVQIEGDCISFYEAADVGDISKRVAYFQNHHLYTDNASIGQQLDIGNFSFIREADGGLSLVYTG